MIDLAEQPGGSWWALIRGNVAACWWRLLAVQALFAGAGRVVLVLSVALNGSGLWAVGDMLRLAAGGLLAAWGWSATLRILDGGHGILSALRPDLRRIGRLGGWLVALDIVGLLGLLVHINIDAYVAIVFSPVMAVIQLGDLYLAFAAALLPMVVLFEGRGFRRAWRLSHGGWRTVLRVLPVVVLGNVASGALTFVQATALGTFPPAPRLLLVQAATFLPGVLQSTLTAVLLYVAYRLSSPRHALAA